MRAPFRALVWGLAGMMAAIPARAGILCPEARPGGFLARDTRETNATSNRDPDGKPILPAYDEAARRIEAGQIVEALPLLDQVARSRDPAARKTWLPFYAERTAAELRRLCEPIPALPPPPAGAKVRRKLSASPKVWWE